MTLEELYLKIDGDYEQATKILRMDKLIDKHIRRFTTNGVIDNLLAAGESMDANALFETAHAAKGVCSNLGLVKLADLSSDISEEFRPGKSRNMSDDEVKARLAEISEVYAKTAAGIKEYTGE